MPFKPTDELVAKAWLTSISGLTAGVAGNLPQDATSWADNGFVQITPIGGDQHLYFAQQDATLSVDTWAVNLNSSKPPWGMANALAEAIRAACLEDELTIQRLLTVGAGYSNARVKAAYCLGRPVKMRSDDASYAHYQFDMNFSWIEVPS